MPDPRHPLKVLVVNCGSSSIKYQLYEMPENRAIAKGLVERIGEPGRRWNITTRTRSGGWKARLPTIEEGMALILETLVGSGGPLRNVKEISAVGHRVVHGGEQFTGSVLITPEVVHRSNGLPIWPRSTTRPI